MRAVTQQRKQELSLGEEVDGGDGKIIQNGDDKHGEGCCYGYPGKEDEKG